ncbi:MAG: mannose-1-phosphate guanylyltransferase [Planctomycetaceae bacterium]|nr:mannose-1-phosphate guanylyltransferase [Planctomycetaceae bacterium]
MLQGVIMSGGSGTRFWPLSRTARPKQFLKFGTDRTLLQSTAERCDPLIPPDRIWVVTNAVQAEESRRQLTAVPPAHVLVEPCGRNTAPCVGLAALQIVRADPDAIMAVMPADHVIGPSDVFREAIAAAARLVEESPARLVLFGVRPTYPATGFGYIEQGEALSEEGPGFHVKSFREKPDHDTATQYLHDGHYLWNCGIFVWKAQTILDRLHEFEPEMHAGLTRIVDGPAEQYQQRLEEEFPELKSISIDYAVLERASDVCVLEAPFQWDDVGSWEALGRLEGADADGNTLVGPHCGLETRNCIVRSEDGHLVATVDVEDLLIVHTADATLVTRRGDEGALRRIIDELKSRGLDAHL